MTAKNNPLKLNPLQLKTLTLLQELARFEQSASHDESGNIRITALPQPHGDHFHLAESVVRAADATGLRNEMVWNALHRKGLAICSFPVSISLTPAGLGYATGMREAILHNSGH